MKNIQKCLAFLVFLVAVQGQAQFGFDVDIELPGETGQAGLRVGVNITQAQLDQVVGVYQGAHPDWRDRVLVFPDGSYRRGNGDPGVWSFDGTTLTLDWTHWGIAHFRRQADGTWYDSNQRFRLTKVSGPEGLPGYESAPQQTQQPAQPARPESRHFRLSQSTFRVGQSILVEYHSMPTGNMEWITLVRRGESDDTWGNWTYTEESNGTFGIEASDIPGPGEYELRAYYSSTDYTVRDRLVFTVQR